MRKVIVILIVILFAAPCFADELETLKWKRNYLTEKIKHAQAVEELSRATQVIVNIELQKVRASIKALDKPEKGEEEK